MKINKRYNRLTKNLDTAMVLFSRMYLENIMGSASASAMSRSSFSGSNSSIRFKISSSILSVHRDVE